MNSTTKLAIFSLTVASIAVTAYLFRNDISDELECLLSNSTKEAALRKLQRFRIALRDLAADVLKAEIAVKSCKESGEHLNSEVKRTITGLSVDLDYIFDTLDAVTGDMTVKERRKKLVDEFKDLAHRVDALSTFIK